MKILHIAVHMGGGVGHSLSDLVIEDGQNEHGIILLQRPEKKQFINICIDAGREVYIEPSLEQIARKMAKSDIIILHWWHHPIMCQLLSEFPQIPIRLILWSHVSGCTYPALSYELLEKFHKVFITSKYTLDNPEWSHEQRKKMMQKASLVYGLGHLSKIMPKSDNGFPKRKIKVGYVGTLAKSKLHPLFPEICKEILEQNSDIEFYIAGDCGSGQWIKEKLKRLEIEDSVHFMGYIEDINKCLQQFDIFGYPLNSYHFGTTENAILEAMAAGLPVVLLNQATERYIIENGKDGILANGIPEYVKAVTELAGDEQRRRQLGKQGVDNVYKKFSFSQNLEHFQRACQEEMNNQKEIVTFCDIMGKTSWEWFLSAVNQNDKELLQNEKYKMLPAIFYEKNKSSIIHFATVYPADRELQIWKTRLENEKGKEIDGNTINRRDK